MQQVKHYIHRAIITALVCLLHTNAFAQIEPEARNRKMPNLPKYEMQWLHFGFLIGINFQDYHIYNTGARTLENGYTAIYGDVAKLTPGVTLGIVTDLRLCNHVNFRCLPGISFGEKRIAFANEYGEKLEEELKIKSTYIDLPLEFKFSSFRLKNFGVYATLGNTFRYDLAKDKQSHLQMKSFDVYFDAGAGIDIYLPYFRFSVGLKGSFGVNNLYKAISQPDDEDLPYQQAIDGIKSRIFGITFYFE